MEWGSLDVSSPPARAQDGAALQLDALHCLAVQHYRLLLAVVKALVPIPVPVVQQPVLPSLTTPTCSHIFSSGPHVLTRSGFLNNLKGFPARHSHTGMTFSNKLVHALKRESGSQVDACDNFPLSAPSRAGRPLSSQ